MTMTEEEMHGELQGVLLTPGRRADLGVLGAARLQRPSRR